MSPGHVRRGQTEKSIGLTFASFVYRLWLHPSTAVLTLITCTFSIDSFTADVNIAPFDIQTDLMVKFLQTLMCFNICIGMYSNTQI